MELVVKAVERILTRLTTRAISRLMTTDTTGSSSKWLSVLAVRPCNL